MMRFVTAPFCLGMVVALLAGAGIVAQSPAPSATQPATQAYRDRIARLIDEVDNEDYQIREDATRALIEIGPDVLVFINKRLAEDPTPEFSSRAKTIFAAIAEKWKFISSQGGAVVAGLQATLIPPGKSFAPGEKIAFNVILSNVSPNPRTILDIRGFDIELPDTGAKFTSPRSDARIVIRKIGDARLPTEGKAVVYEDPDLKIDFRTGGNINMRIPLSSAVTLGPGEYEITFVWYAMTRQILPDALEDLRSNSVRVKIETNGDQGR